MLSQRKLGSICLCAWIETFLEWAIIPFSITRATSKHCETDAVKEQLFFWTFSQDKFQTTSPHFLWLWELWWLCALSNWEGTRRKWKTSENITTHLLWEDAPSSHTSDHCRCRHRSPGSWSTWTARLRLGPCRCVHSSLSKQSAYNTHSLCNNIEQNWTGCIMCLKSVYCTCLFIKVFVVDDDALAHSLVAHLILECWWNNSVMAFRRVVLLPRLAILILLTSGVREKTKYYGKLTHPQWHY